MSTRSDDVLGPEGEVLRWFLYPWEGGNGGIPSSGGGVAPPQGGGCIVKPKVYGGVAADAAAGAGVSGASLEEDGGRRGEAVATAAPVAPRGVGQENGQKAAAQSDPGFVNAAAAERGTGVVPPPPHESGTSGSGDGDAATAGGGVEPVPQRPFPTGGNGEEQHAEDESAAAAAAAGNDNDGAASPPTDIGDDNNPTKRRNRQPDDSHKYPLRQANRDSGVGKTGGLLLAAEAPAFLASSSSPAANGTGSAAVSGYTGNGGGANGGDGANGEGVESSGGKLKGYEGHMSALGKLGAGSAESRLFPTPGKKIMRAVGQAVQVGDAFDAGRNRVFCYRQSRPYGRVWVVLLPIVLGACHCVTTERVIPRKGAYVVRLLQLLCCPLGDVAFSAARFRYVYEDTIFLKVRTLGMGVL